MARAKDENKRAMILQSAKMLFSQNGFFNTSISDIVKETSLPVGSIYTYFKSKEEIVRTIVDEGWGDLRTRLFTMLGSSQSVENKLKSVIDQFIPEVLQDLDLVNILLSEAIIYTKIEEKVEELSTAIMMLLKPAIKDSDMITDLDKNTWQAGLGVYFLGILNTVKLARTTSIGIKVSDILKFVKISIEKSLGLKL
ncbi:MAG: TetR/AcrR family transcriptional regulator [Spirochaetaceae bacterium]|nr:MAG: TetR/AcrR family transcriptional regulator [Spirochaetaceae bacterium]